MDLKSIVSISGMPGLFKIISKTQNSLVVESLIDKKRFPVFASHQVTSLEDISVFTTKEDLSLKVVLEKIFILENKGPAIDSKSDDKKLKEYFEKALPEYDKERVYTSHIKKIIAWYNLLQGLDMLNPSEEELKEKEKVDENPQVTEEVKEEKKEEASKIKEKKEATIVKKETKPKAPKKTK